MLASETPKFLVEKRSLKPRKLAVKVAAKLTKKRKKYDESKGDLGTPELRARTLEADIAAMTDTEQKQYFSGHRGTMRVGITLEARGRSSTGHMEKQGARIETQLPHDRYKVRKQLDPDDDWRNLMMWESAERLRRDYELSGINARLGGSFEPRIKGGSGDHEAERTINAQKRYKVAMSAIGVSLRSVVIGVCIWGETAEAWARRNAKGPQSGIIILRQGLAELAHHYGLAKISC